MSADNPQIGDVFRSEVPYSGRDDGLDEKHRYFIYLGRSGIFDLPAVVYPESTTTKGKNEEALDLLKSKHVCVDFKSKSGEFSEHCVLCLDFIEPKEKNFFKTYRLEYQFTISADKLREIYFKLDEADITPKDKKNIKESYARENKTPQK